MTDFASLAARIEADLDVVFAGIMSPNERLVPNTISEAEAKALDAVADARAALAEMKERAERMEEALMEIESFPISGYHAGAAQRIARAALSSPETDRP